MASIDGSIGRRPTDDLVAGATIRAHLDAKIKKDRPVWKDPRIAAEKAAGKKIPTQEALSGLPDHTMEDFRVKERDWTADVSNQGLLKFQHPTQ